MNFNNSNTCMYYNFTMNKKTTLMNSKTEHYQVFTDITKCFQNINNKRNRNGTSQPCRS